MYDVLILSVIIYQLHNVVFNFICIGCEKEESKFTINCQCIVFSIKKGYMQNKACPVVNLVFSNVI